MLRAHDSAGNITIGLDGEPKPIFRCFNYNCLQDVDVRSTWTRPRSSARNQRKRNSRLAKKGVTHEAGEAVGNSKGTRSVRSERQGPCRNLEIMGALPLHAPRKGGTVPAHLLTCTPLVAARDVCHAGHEQPQAHWYRAPLRGAHQLDRRG